MSGQYVYVRYSPAGASGVYRSLMVAKNGREWECLRPRSSWVATGPGEVPFEVIKRMRVS